MGEIVALIGPTGAGKTVQGDRLAEALGWTHISTGRALRQDPTMEQHLRSGGLAPSTEVYRILLAAVQQAPVDRTIILDGFPRLVEQAKWLDAQDQVWHRHLRCVVVLDIDQATSEARLLARGRSDDNLSALRRKWQEYRQITQPVEAYYEQQGKLVTVDGRGSIEDVNERLRTALS